MQRIHRLVNFLIMLSLVWHTSAFAFSNSSFKGNYAYMLTGLSSIVLANEPNTVATGVLTADGIGGVSGHGIFRSADIACKVLFNGTYTINTNGSGNIHTTSTSTTPGCVGEIMDFNLIVADNGRIINVANSENDYMSGTLMRQNKNQFSLTDLSGSYSLSLQGHSSIVSASEPYTVGVGLIHADGKGNISGNASFRSYGVSCSGSLEGSNQIMADGSGTINLNFITSSAWCTSGVVDLSLALVNGNNAMVANSENDLMTGNITRQTFK